MKMIQAARLSAITLTFSCVLNSHVMASENFVELATEKGCFTCHSIAPDANVKKPLAPSYQDIAARYRDNPDAQTILLERILTGTVTKEQNWEGEVNMRFMPPNLNTSREEAKDLIKGIFDLHGAAPVTSKLKQHEKMLTLATKSSCLTCHNLAPLAANTKAIPLAPALREIAAYYEGTEGAREKLISSIKHGTIEKPKTWVNVNMAYMPPNIAVNDADIEALADWILNLQHDGIKKPVLSHK